MPTHKSILRMAWPIMLANAAVPLLGIADTAIIGNTGRVADLGAIALGSLIFHFVSWGFGFLRMGTTGFTAQAAGSSDEPEVRAVLGRALIQACVLGAVFIALQGPIARLAFALFDASREVESIARAYYDVRIWGAPATLLLFCVFGSFIGLGRSRDLLIVQLFLNGLNIGLDLVFAGILGMGARGVALGTVIAEWTTLGVSLTICILTLRRRRTDDEPFWPWARIRDPDRFFKTLTANRDILIRSLFLLFGFSWFTNRGARFGDVVLASNHVLLQFISLSAFFLDGYAFVAESLVGRAIGAKRHGTLRLAVRRSTELAAATALLLSALIAIFGPYAITKLAESAEVRSTAVRYLPFACVYVLLSFAAFQLDGIFIGATRAREMRNASVLSASIFVAVSLPLAHWLGNVGLWIAFIVYVLLRALALGAYYPSRVASSPRSSGPVSEGGPTDSL